MARRSTRNAKIVPACLLVGVATSALALSGTAASAATTVPPSPAQAATDLGVVEAAAPHASASPALRTTAQGPRHAAGPATYTVAASDTLSTISIRFCRTAADYRSLAAASGITNPDLTYPGQTIKLDCHHAPAAFSQAAASSRGHSVPAAPAPTRPSRTVLTSGMSAFEACVISRESSGNPRAVKAMAARPVDGLNSQVLSFVAMPRARCWRCLPDNGWEASGDLL